MKKLLKILLGIVLVLALLGVIGYFALQAMWADTAGRAPESATGRRQIAHVRTSTTMVVSAHPLATEAGWTVLEAGGSAIDAAVAVQAALTVVEPQSSGIGGGAFLLYYSAEHGELFAFDGRETAPAQATPSLFAHEDGTPYSFIEAVVGGRSVGTPGVLRMLAQAHAEHGARPWAELFEPAIGLAQSGFDVTPRLHKLLALDPHFRTMAAARAHFYDEGGAAKTVGTRLVNPELAEALRLIGQDVESFYSGPIAEDMVAAVKAAQRPSTLLSSVNASMIEMGAPSGIGWLADVDNPGLLSMEDLAAYEAKVRKPVCIPFRAYRVCGFPPPTSGGITTLQIIGMLGHHPLEGVDPRGPDFAHLFAEASRVAFADRNVYIADPDFVDVPTAALLAPEYLKLRAALFSTGKRATDLGPGQVSEAKTARYAPDASPELPCTSHFVVRDAKGDMVSMTTSVENVFGSRVMVRGFLLNNQLTDFSFLAERGGKPVANAVAPNKRPRSSMSPLMVFDEAGAPVLAIGSPGGSRIIDYTAQSALGILAFGLDPQAAVELPHIINRGGVTELENAGWQAGELEAAKVHLQGLGHQVVVRDQNSGLHAIQVTKDGLRAGIDPRREGAARGR